MTAPIACLLLLLVSSPPAAAAMHPAGAAVLPAGLGGAQAQPDDAEMQRLRADFASAVDQFNSINQPESIAQFNRIITVLERRVGADAEDSGARALLVGSLTYRGRANLNVGNNAEADADVRALINTDPAATLNRQEMSPLFVQLFDAAHAGMVGFFEFAVSPVDAEIRIDGRLLEPGVVSHPVVVGTHSVVVERPGYQPEQNEVEVAAGGTILVDNLLIRLSAVVEVLSRPNGATVTMDGQPMGTTEGIASSDFVPTGDAALYPSTDFSEALVIQGLQPGRHTLEVSLDGFRTRRSEIEVEDLVDYRSTVVLEETAGTVVLEGLTADAEVSVDGAVTVPQWPGGGGSAQLSLAPGRHTIEVSRGTAGVFATSIDVADQQAQVVSVRLRPGLAFLGVLGGDDRGARDIAGLLTGTLGAIDNWTVLDRTWAEPRFGDVGLTAEALRAAADNVGVAPDWAAIQAAFDEDAPGSVYMLGVLNDDLLATYADLWIWPAAPGPAQPDRVRVGVDSSADVAALAGGFQTETFLSGTWFGALMVDVGDAVIATSVSGGGPAEAAGLLVGDRVVSIAGEVLDGAAAGLSVIDNAAVGAVLAVQVQRGAATQIVEVTLGSSPRVISPLDPRLVYSVISASLAAELADTSGTAPGWVVELNQAAVLIHAGAWEDTVRILRGIEDAPTGAGIGQATVEYMLGIALTALGPTYRDSAIQAFQRAAADPDARLFHNDGPWVAPRAAARLTELGGR